MCHLIHKRPWPHSSLHHIHILPWCVVHMFMAVIQSLTFWHIIRLSYMLPPQCFHPKQHSGTSLGCHTCYHHNAFIQNNICTYYAQDLASHHTAIQVAPHFFMCNICHTE